MVQERAEMVKEKKEYEKQFTKPLLQRVVPDTPLKIAVWTTVLAGITGLTTYAIIKRIEL